MFFEVQRVLSIESLLTIETFSETIVFSACTYLIYFKATPNMTLNFSNIYQNCEIVDNATSRGSGRVAYYDNDIDVDEKIHNENPHGDIHMKGKSIPYIAVRYLGNIINEKSKNENDGFQKEYAVG